MTQPDMRTVHSNALEQGYRRGYQAARRTAKDDLRPTIRRWYHRALDAEAYAAHLEQVIDEHYDPGTGDLGAMRERVVLGTMLHHELAPDAVPLRPAHFTAWNSMVFRALARAATPWRAEPFVIAVGDVLRERGTSPGYLELEQLTLERTDEANLMAVAVELAEIREMTTRLMELS